MRSDPSKVLVPRLGARIEERRQRTGLRIDRGDVRPLVPIAPQARQREVVEHGRATVLQCDNVIRLVAVRGERLGKAAVLTARPGPASHGRTEIGTDGVGQLAFRARFSGDLDLEQDDEVLNPLEFLEFRSFLLAGHAGRVEREKPSQPILRSIGHVKVEHGDR